MTSHVLNTLGLVLGMAGVLVIFRWGPPQPEFSESVGIGISPATVLKDGTKVADIIADARRLKDKHWKMSSLGLGLVFIGFAVQLVAVWMG
jgi:hypothetical protein